VIDETDVVLSAPSSTHFLQELLESARLRFVVIGRQRPAWVSTRKLLYAEIAEIDRDKLAFTEAEAAQLLSALPGASTRAMWSRTKGWPAVLRLAVLTQNASLPDEPIGSSLHEYFAEELLEIASAELQTRLPCLALLPTLRGDVLQVVLGDDSQRLQAEALEIGFLSSSGVNEFEMHPLLRSFLTTKFNPATGVGDSRELLLRLLDLREWDNAFSLIANARLYDYLPQLVARSLDSLLSEGRLTTLDDWVALGLAQNIDSPDLSLLEAELSRRAGAFSAASSQALKAAEAYRAAGHPWASRSFSIAGICAHLSRYSPDAAEHYAKARAASQVMRTLVRPFGANSLPATPKKTKRPRLF
jgi:ATP/maltotriose-dependent transcriptional regulator MalT